MGDEHPLASDVRSIVERLSDRDWDSLTLQLARYALYKSQRFYWRTGNSGELPFGEMTESIVSKAFYLWLAGRRKWNRAEYVDLLSFLKSIIDSLLSHAANSHDNRLVEWTDSPVSRSEGTPESELLEKERIAETELTLREIVRQAQNDAMALEVIDAIRAGAVTRREIVQATGRSVADIDNALKRLRRLGAHIARSKRYENEKVQ